MKFNCVVANPPFSLDKWGAENAESDQHNRFWRGVPPKSKGDRAFISHMVETALEKQGRVAVVVPQGVLFRGAAEGRIRQKRSEYLFSEENIQSAIQKLKNIKYDGLVKTNEAIYDLITLGTAMEQTIEGDLKSFNMNYVDWRNPERNKFHVTVEYSVER